MQAAVRLIKEKEELSAEVEKCKYGLYAISNCSNLIECFSRSETSSVVESSKEVEKNFRMISDRHRHLQAEHEKTKAHLETALKNRNVLDQRLAKIKEENKALARKAGIQEKVFPSMKLI